MTASAVSPFHTMSNRQFRAPFTGLLLLLAGFLPARAQEVDEVTLTFGFPAIGQVYVSAVFRGNQPMLAVGEMLGLLFIPYNRTANSFGMKGAYPGKTDLWEIDPVKLTRLRRGERVALNADKFYLGETDLYVTPDVFQDIFGFELIVNPYGLMLSLKSSVPLPIEELKKRQELRSALRDQAPENILKTYPMLYPRKRAFFAPGMLDYNVGINQSVSNTQLNYALNMGVEVLGGDVQGGVFGYRSSNDPTNRSFGNTGFRWRYVFKGGLDPIGNPIISEISAGQVNLGGPFGGRIRGVTISNTPLVPRRVLDLFAIEGVTTPDSEVELLIGGQLVDFTRADEVGYYRFSTPISYGTVRIGLRIYTPNGEVLFEDRQLQIPFTFVPRGVANYNVQVGYRELALGQLGTTPVAHADVAYGITNNITLRTGATRGADSISTAIQPYGSLNLRLLDQYLLNIEAFPDQFIRASGSVFYANSVSINGQYTSFIGLGALNRLGQVSTSTANVFVPFTILKRTSGFRLGAEQVQFNDGVGLNYQADFNTRVGQIVSRLNYREELLERNDIVSAPKRLITASFTYTIPRNPGIPVFVRGMFFRTQLRHDLKKFDASALGSIQFSQTLFKKGRLTLGYDRDFLQKGNQFQIGFLYDFNALRTASQSTIRQVGRRVEASFVQTFSGSLAADLSNGAIVPTNRDQVGRAGASVRLFVDDNGNSKFDKGEEVISAKAIRLDQSSNMLIGSDGVLRITQLQSYWTYRLTLDVNSLPDPNLAPTITKFSFVADPNRFKHIDIALYRTGSIDGKVFRERKSGLVEPQPGLRLYLQRKGDEAPLPAIRTFSDGGFYAFGLLPGQYSLVVDSGQMSYMKVQMVPDTFHFEIQALAEGDYIENIELRLVPAKEDSANKEDGMTLAELEYMLGEQLKATVGAFVGAQETFYQGKYKESLRRVDSSLAIFESDFGLALKGSIVFVLGNKDDGRRYWQMARERNPFIVIPDSTSIRPRKDSVFTPNEQWVELPKPLVLDSAEQVKAEFMARLEAQLSDKLAQSVSLFVEAQEYFYRRQFIEAELTVDSSLNLFVSDHGLALKGSIAYITGKKAEARRLWEEARYRNPLITLPDTEILDRMIKPITETSQRNVRKTPATN